MYRYRYDRGTSKELMPDNTYRAKPLEKLARLGRIQKVSAVRYRARLKNYITVRERIRVVGENGSASFSGTCWGYGGAGPRATLNILLNCGVEKSRAESLAFHSKRNENCGIDWELYF